MVVIESAILLGVGYKYLKHRKSKLILRQAEATAASANTIYSQSYGSSQPPPSYSAAVLAPTQRQEPPACQPSVGEKRVDATPEMLQLLQQEPVWRPVYMLERSISDTKFNNIRTHRALFVGDFSHDQNLRSGKTHEIRKEKSSILGVRVPLKRTMRYSDAEQWVGEDALDRAPVYLGKTDWSDEDLNREGREMVLEYPTYSLNYANCQHFVADLAEKIIPREKMDHNGMRSTQPALNKLIFDIEAGEYDGHANAVVNRVADLALGTGQQTTKFFHFTKAMLYSMATFSWKPFDEYNHFLHRGNLRLIAAHAREDQRRPARYISGQMSGSSSASGSSQRLGDVSE